LKENLLLIDADYILAENKPVIRLYCKDSKGKTVLVLESSFEPYFFVMPKKGKLSRKDEREEHSEEFVRMRRQHSAVESAINALENHGLDRCPDHGIYGFKRYVALAVLARNLQRLGHIVQQKELKRQARREKPRLRAA